MFFKKNGPIAITVGLYLLYLGVSYLCPTFQTRIKSVFSHPKVSLGIPAAAIFSLILTSFDKEDQLTILGWKTKGLAGRVILWTIVFSALIISIEILW
jgi:hypothetical protein